MFGIVPDGAECDRHSYGEQSRATDTRSSELAKHKSTGREGQGVRIEGRRQHRKEMASRKTLAVPEQGRTQSFSAVSRESQWLWRSP